jgi:hypothetical protein
MGPYKTPQVKVTDFELPDYGDWHYWTIERFRDGIE